MLLRASFFAIVFMSHLAGVHDQIPNLCVDYTRSVSSCSLINFQYLARQSERATFGQQVAIFID